VYQRSPQWILPRGDRPYSGLEKTLYRHVPGALAASRLCHFWRSEFRALAFILKPKWMRYGQKKALRFLEASIPDPAMRSKLTPQYRMGCKRILLSDTFYPALARENVELVTDAIRSITPRGIVAADGVERPADAIVYATGFRPFNVTDAIRVQGRDGRLLGEEWRDGPRAFRGVAVNGYPNFFMIMGPNSGLGHNSIVFMIESQVRYILRCLRWLESGMRDAVEVKAEVEDAFNDMLEAAFVRSVWRPKKTPQDKVGCSSWYTHASGRNTAIWPGFASSYRLSMMRASLADFEPARPREIEQPLPVPARRAA
jgi:cation diffusion facilitator CzcD-associated flavoprotein CzcO